MPTITQSVPSTPKTKARRDILRELLTEKGVASRDVDAILAAIAPKPREMDPNKPIPAGMLIPAATVFARAWLAGKAGVDEASMYTERQAHLCQRIDAGDRAKHHAEVCNALERLMADESKRTVVGKDGKKKPSAAWLAFVAIKASLADG